MNKLMIRMMAKNIIILIVLILGLWSFYRTFVRPNNAVFKEIKRNVKIVKDGKIDPANEGSLVLVSGKLSSCNVLDYGSLDFSFESCGIKMQVEDFDSTNWVENPGGVFEFFSNTQLGEYFVDEELIKTLTDPYYTGNVGEYTYDKDSGYLVYKDNTRRLKFQYVDMNREYTILAKQVGNTFEPYDVNGKNQEIYEIYNRRIDNLKDLEEQINTGKISSKVFTGVVGFVFLTSILSFLFKKDYYFDYH